MNSGPTNYEELRELQASQCEPLSAAEITAVANGIPPSACSILEPRELYQRVENNQLADNEQTPFQAIMEWLEPQKQQNSLSLASAFGQSASMEDFIKNENNWEMKV